MSPQAETGSDAEVYRQVYATALRLLVPREHSVHELRLKLKARCCPAAVAEEVLAALQQERALSDTRFVETYMRSRFERGFGPVRIAAELRERGVDQRLIDATVTHHASAWQASARRQRHKRFGVGLPAGFSDRARQMRFLQQRGFTAEQVHAAFAAEAEADN